MKKIPTYRVSISLLQKANARKPVDIFIDFVLPFKTEIINENQKFFLQQNYGEDIGGNDNTAVEAIHI